MNSTWRVYPVSTNQPKSPEARGASRPKPPKRWLVRWRVNGVMRKRSFQQRGHADTFRDLLIEAKVKGWDADERGWPVDPGASDVQQPDLQARGLTFEDYATTWYDVRRAGFGDKTRRGHRDNMHFAIAALRYQVTDPRLAGGRSTAGESILMADLVADDVLRAISTRLTTNARTARTNQRLIRDAYTHGLPAVGLLPERASKATVRSFYVTLAMIINAARHSNVISHNPLLGTARHAPKPQPGRLTSRIVPSIEEIFDLAEAISKLGPLMTNGHHAGDRFRSLILCAGTLGPRPGELVAHEPTWIDWDDDTTMMRFEASAGRVYDPAEGVTGLQLNSLKHRSEGERREVPMLSAVADAVKVHLERGYATPERTWTGTNGEAALDWSNIKDVYWRPALEKVFGGSAKAHLVTMQPRMLRKAAITFWLDSGIHPLLAAEWAGHSEDVSKRYYAGRSSATYAPEAGMLALGHQAAIDEEPGQRGRAS